MRLIKRQTVFLSKLHELSDAIVPVHTGETMCGIVGYIGEKNATGIPVPNDVIIAFNAGKRPKVKVTINEYLSNNRCSHGWCIYPPL